MIEKIIINEVHPSINVWHGWHFMKYAKEKQRWMEMVGWLCKGKKKFVGKVEIEVVTYFETKRKHDLDNYAPKFILDPIVRSGVIEDDNSEIITKLSTVFKYDAIHPRTEVIIYQQ